MFEAHFGRSERGVAYTYVLGFKFIRTDHAEFATLNQGSPTSGSIPRMAADQA